jgi:hypothetical protein
METIGITVQRGLDKSGEGGRHGGADLGESARAQASLTETLWGLRWDQVLPQSLGHDVLVAASSFDQVLPFMEQHYSTIFEDQGETRFFRGRNPMAKARYYRAVADFFEFKQAGNTVALVIGMPTDWSTYYIRSTAALPQVQGSMIIQPFMPILLDNLKSAGVERVEMDTSATNMAVLHWIMRYRFNPSGTVLTDRWGALVRFTRFLDGDAERVFINQFCSGIHYQLRTKPGSRRASVTGE